MLRKFAAALLAASLVTGAAARSGSAGTAAAVQTVPVNPEKPAMPARHATHKQTHKHFARSTHGTKVAHHVKGKVHTSHVVRIHKGAKHAERASVKTAKLPASRTN